MVLFSKEKDKIVNEYSSKHLSPIFIMYSRVTYNEINEM